MSSEKVEKILLWLVKIGVFFILFTPLLMHSSYYFPFIVFKNVVFRIVVEVIFTAYLILAHINPKYRLKFNGLVYAVGGFFLISIIAGSFGIGFFRSFWGNYERMSGLFAHLHLLMFFLTIVGSFKTKKDWHQVLTFSVFASLIMSFLAFAQWLKVPFILQSSGGERLTSTIGNAAFLSAYLLIHLFFILYFWFKEKRFNIRLFGLSFIILDVYLILLEVIGKVFADSSLGWFNFLKSPILSESLNYQKLFLPFLIFQGLIALAWYFKNKRHAVRALLSIVLLFEFFIMFSTQTRGALVGLFISVIVMSVIALIIKIRKKFKMVAGVVLLLAMLLPISLIVFKDSNIVKSNTTLRRLSSISLNDVTTESRFLTWKASYDGWMESPKSFLIGYGPENYYYAFNKNFPSELYKDKGSRVWFDRAHNIVYDTLVTTGILGLFVYLSIIFVSVYILFKNYQAEKKFSSSWLLVGLLVAYFIQNLFVFDTLNTEIPIYLFLGFIAFIGFKNKQVENLEKSEDSVNFGYLSGVIVIATLLIFGVNVKTLQANNYLVKAIITPEIGAGIDSNKFENYKQAINDSIMGRYEVRQQFINYVGQSIYSGRLTSSQAKDLLTEAEAEMRKSILEEPKNIRHYMLLAGLWNSTVSIDKTNTFKIVSLLNNKVINLSPTRPHLYYEVARAYGFSGNFEKLNEYYLKGLNLSPWVIEDNRSLLSFYIIFEKFDLAEQQFDYMIYELGWKPLVSDLDSISSLYESVGNKQKVEEINSLIQKIKNESK